MTERGRSMSRHNIWIRPELWERATKASLVASVQEGERVSVAELIRRGLESQVAQYEGSES